VAAAVVWGLSWLAWGRFGDEPRSMVVGAAAVVAALAVAAASVVLTLRGRREARDADSRSAEPVQSDSAIH
jgi:hypothetical protein